MNQLDRLATFLYGFSPRSALVCSGEGDPPGDGGAPATPAAPVTPPANPGTSPVTPEVQALIDAARADERTKTSNSVWKQAREKYEKGQGGQQPQQPPKQEPPPNGNGQDALAILALRDAFDDATSELTLTGPQKKFVRELVMKERPADVADYVSNFVTLSGWNAKQPIPAAPATGAQPAQPANPVVPSGPPVTSRGTPPPAATPTDDVPIMSMSEADKRALAARIGDKAFAERFLKELAKGGTRIRPRT